MKSGLGVMQDLHNPQDSKNILLNSNTRKNTMSTVESLGITQTIRIGEPSDREVDNYSRKIAIIHEGTTIPLLGRSDETDAVHEIRGAHEITAVDAEVKGEYIYLVGKSTGNFAQEFYNLTRYDRSSGIETDTWDSKSFSFVGEGKTAWITIVDDTWEQYEGTPFAHYKDDFRKFREEFSFLSIPEHGTGSINSTSTSESSNSEDEIIEISAPNKFKVKNIDKITNFNPSTDSLEIDADSFGIDSSATFAAGKNKKEVKKTLAKQDFDFLYDQKKGGLYFNENGADKGFGDGRIIAILKGASDLSMDNIDFV